MVTTLHFKIPSTVWLIGLCMGLLTVVVVSLSLVFRSKRSVRPQVAMVLPLSAMVTQLMSQTERWHFYQNLLIRCLTFSFRHKSETSKKVSEALPTLLTAFSPLRACLFPPEFHSRLGTGGPVSSRLLEPAHHPSPGALFSATTQEHTVL